MLRKALMVLGALGLLLGLVAAVSGIGRIFLPQLLIVSVVLLLGVGLERWRYRALRNDAPDPRWEDTGERFVDPESGRLTAVYFDAETARRHYVIVRDTRG